MFNRFIFMVHVKASKTTGFITLRTLNKIQENLRACSVLRGWLADRKKWPVIIDRVKEGCKVI